MDHSPSYSFQRYLAAKKPIDDRSLNQHVWAKLLSVLPSDAGLRVLEIGAGTGTMLNRLVEWGFPVGALHYTGVDSQAANIAQARQISVPRSIAAQWVAADAFDFVAGYAGESFDVLIAHAFLDLLDVPKALPRLLAVLKPGGLVYFTINFDGLTTFEPLIEPALDATIERLYHQSMDERITDGEPSGDSRAGRHLFHQMRAAGIDVLAAGASDWVVTPTSDGKYPGDEAYFLQHILYFVEQTLTNHPELDPQEFDSWLAQRRAQITRGELVYIAHQLDYLGRFAGA